jgi:alkylhydroperoxidase family enzyme
VLDDWRTAEITPRLKAMLGYLEKLTLTPDAVGPSDVEALRAAGIDDEAYRDAVWVAFAFNTITRIADSLGWDIPDDAGFEASATMLLSRGYVLQKPTPRRARG